MKNEEPKKFTVTSEDVNGNLISDLSKVIVPQELSDQVRHIINRDNEELEMSKDGKISPATGETESERKQRHERIQKQVAIDKKEHPEWFSHDAKFTTKKGDWKKVPGQHSDQSKNTPN